MEVNNYLKARDEYIEAIKAELLGPGSEVSIPDKEHEIVTTSPNKRYSIGILFPKDNKLNADNDDTARLEENTDPDDEAVEEEDAESETSERMGEPVNPSEEDNLDEEIGLAAQNMPSSMGFTFLVTENIAELNCLVEFATYKRALVPDCRYPFSPKDGETFTVPPVLSEYIKYDSSEGTLKLLRKLSRKELREIRERDVLEGEENNILPAIYKLCDQLSGGYVRIPHSVRVTVDFSQGDYADDNSELDGTSAKITALKRRLPDGLYSVTLMLVNDSTAKNDGTRCLFQPVVTVSTDDNEFSFAEYSALTDFSILDSEEQSLELQYRNRKVYGSGLGTSVKWEIDGSGQGILYNDFFPEVEVPSMDFGIPKDSGIDPKALSMRFLSDLDDTPKAEKIGKMKTVVSGYKRWIEGLRAKRDELKSEFLSIADRNILGCEKSSDRMDEGLDLLISNDYAWTAFMLANRAMFMQRVHITIQNKTSDIDRYPYDEELSDILESVDYADLSGYTQDVYNWRLFQIAFLLMSINSIVNDKSDDRKLVDLIWFPTGGGKTEAYLGLTAFSIFYRRLAHPDHSDGTTVMMRYTLRLLAAQQFTRAATLICACEYIRTDAVSRRPKYSRYPLGNSEISIGLWIGGTHTPNTDNDANTHLRELLKANANSLQYVMEEHNKFQVLKCPWCGTKMIKGRNGRETLGAFGYRMSNKRHFELFCPQESCFFNQRGKLPIQIVDEELYLNPPTLLFGTVDKFAMMPWRKEIGSFFGLETENRAPELIIQDELHLISGPLGTMVGLYESVIEALCSSKGVPPKIVASTATIRRAAEQCSALYNRDVEQFPHPGLDADDSFFAKESVIDYEKGVFGRKYIGLMPSGKTKAMMEVRAISALMQIIHTMDLTDEVRDKFWTLTVYFNSLKDLGKCSTLVEDDVKDFIKRMYYRVGSPRGQRIITGADELTSRVSTTDLNETLDKLEKLVYSEKNIEEKRYPSNILLATNMISVGIDVARLNVMLLVGQPKLTSEYIQASSRIGRSYPGVAFTLYDGSKSRDRSHYEQFKPYHESFYRYVEPTGATPFSKPARDRALHAAVIAMLRLLNDDLSDDKEAANFKRARYTDATDKIKVYLIRRCSEIQNRLNANMTDESSELSVEIDGVLEKWEKLAANYNEDRFSYGEKYMIRHPEDGYGRLLKQFNSDRNDPAFNTMTSMRNVDSTVRGNVLVWEE
ncbi:MAG: helicase [Oscillospiraceae bacterium]|nr:helicase [Oscillospiraceae bacterium]